MDNEKLIHFKSGFNRGIMRNQLWLRLILTIVVAPLAGWLTAQILEAPSGNIMMVALALGILYLFLTLLNQLPQSIVIGKTTVEILQVNVLGKPQVILISREELKKCLRLESVYHEGDLHYEKLTINLPKGPRVVLKGGKLGWEDEQLRLIHHFIMKDLMPQKKKPEFSIL